MRDLLLQTFGWAVQSPACGSLAAIAVVAIQLLIGRRISPGCRALLWSLVLVRLILPIAPQSRWSMFNLWHTPPSVMKTDTRETQPTVIFGVIPPATSIAQSTSALTSPEHRAIQWNVVAAMVWLVVTVGFLARIIFVNARFHRQLIAMPEITDRRLRDLLERCRLETRAPRVRAVQSGLSVGPALAGAFRPVLLLPATLCETLDESLLAFIFRHELIHARRRDLLLNWIMAMIVTLHWFNPIAWLVAKRIRAERELACDEAVLIGQSHRDRVRYGELILWMSERFSIVMPKSIPGLTDTPSALRRRIAAIAQPRKSSLVLTFLALFAMILIGCTTLTSAKHTTTTSPTQSSHLIQQVYDVRDLLVHIPDFNNAPDFNLISDKTHSNAPGGADSAPTHENMVNGLIRQIQTSVAPDSWQANGPGTIRESDGQLIIEQTSSNHEAIQQFIQSLRSKRAIQVTIEARFLRGGDDELETWMTQRKGEWAQTGDAAMWSRPLRDDESQELIGVRQKIPTASMITAPRITVFDGQRAYVLVATSRAFVKDLHPSASTTQPTMPGYDPEIGVVQSGVLLDVQAAVSNDHRNVTLTLKPQLNSLVDMTSEPWPNRPADRTDLIVQIPHTRSAVLDTTLTVANGQTLLFRLNERERPSPTTHPTEANLYLLVRPQVIDQFESGSAKPRPTLETTHSAP